MNSSPVISLSPSFSNNSSTKLTEIAARVVQEFSQQSDTVDTFLVSKIEDDSNPDFSFVCTDANACSVWADEIFSNGKIRSIFPVLNTNEKENSKCHTPRLPLSRLFIEERSNSSCSSCEAGELDRIQAESYCVWTPKKSSSISGSSSKKWKLRDLLHRSSSDGNDSFVLFTPKKATKEGVEAVPVHKGHYVKKVEQRRSFLPYRKDLFGLFAMSMN